MSGGFSTQTLALPALPALDVVADLDLVLPCQVPGTIDLWFAERGDDVERAKAMCRECPLRAECLAGAVRRQEPWGVWGGEVFIDGVVVARKRGRGRPRKVAA
ncbi:MAG: hypothetical protein BGO96_13415 [Micrococcales bacterium 73-15]|nr:MAG: hypothetical protein BGO96_13415 [Micrococcales bacterium 73-15]